MKNLLLFKKLKFTCLLANSMGIQELSRWRRKAVCSSCLVSLMDAKVFRGRGKPCLSRGERISPSRWKME